MIGIELTYLPLPDRVYGDNCKVYLQRKEGWKQLKEIMKKKEGANLVPYSEIITAFEVILQVLILEIWLQV